MDSKAILAYVIGRLVMYHRDIHMDQVYPDTASTQFQMDMHDTATLAIQYANGQITQLGSQYSDIQVSIASDVKLMSEAIKRGNA